MYIDSTLLFDILSAIPFEYFTHKSDIQGQRFILLHRIVFKVFRIFKQFWQKGFGGNNIAPKTTNENFEKIKNCNFWVKIGWSFSFFKIIFCDFGCNAAAVCPLYLIFWNSENFWKLFNSPYFYRFHSTETHWCI